MITYELCLLLRTMQKTKLVTTLKRTAMSIIDRGGIIRKIENMGTRDMPYKTSVHGVVYNKASYYMLEFNMPPSVLEDISEEYGRDVDIVRRTIYKKNTPDVISCTLHEELLPPPYRKPVQELLATVDKTKKQKFKYNSGLDYYPFQK